MMKYLSLLAILSTSSAYAESSNILCYQEPSGYQLKVDLGETNAHFTLTWPDKKYSESGDLKRELKYPGYYYGYVPSFQVSANFSKGIETVKFIYENTNAEEGQDLFLDMTKVDCR